MTGLKLHKVGCHPLDGIQEGSSESANHSPKRSAQTCWYCDQAWLFLFSRDFSKLANEGKVTIERIKGVKEEGKKGERLSLSPAPFSSYRSITLLFHREIYQNNSLYSLFPVINEKNLGWGQQNTWKKWTFKNTSSIITFDLWLALWQLTFLSFYL